MKRILISALALAFAASAYAADTIQSGHVLGNGTATERTPQDASLISVAAQPGSGLGTGVATALGIAANATGGFTIVPQSLSLLATQAANTVVGNPTSIVAAPTAIAVGSCSTASSALIWTTNSGFGCNTSINASTLGNATFASPGAIGGTAASSGLFTFTENSAGGHFYGLYTGSYISGDGTVIDYVHPNARIIGGTTDNTCFYNNGPTTPTLLGCFNNGGLVKPAVGYSNVNLFASVTAPTISSGFGSSPSIAAHNGTVAFQVNVGTGGSASQGVVGMPSATNGWSCSVTDVTTQNSTVFLTKQTAYTQTSVQVTNYNTSGSSAAWASSDKLNFLCAAF